MTDRTRPQKKPSLLLRLAYAFGSIKFSALWVLLVVPLLSVLFITASGESPLYTSLSRLAWVSGHWWFMLVWSTIVLFALVCMTVKVVRASGLGQKQVRVLSITAVCNILLAFVSGVFLPAKSSAEILTVWAFLHDNFTALGWLSFGITLTIFAVLLRRVDKTQATIALAFMAFVWITGVFAIFYVIDPQTYCGSSSVSQVYIINMFNIFLLLNDVYQSRGARPEESAVPELPQ